MQLQLQLYIEGQPVELHDNESVVLRQSIQDVRDIKKIFTDFTKTFNVPASKNNNKIFKHFYNSSIEGFDARNKKTAQLHLNYNFFKNGKIRLEGVQMANNKPVNYRITFFGETINLPDLVGDDKLDQLAQLSDFAVEYDADTIIDLMGTPKDVTTNGEDFEDAVVVPLITHSQRLYYDSSEDIEGTGNLALGSTTKGVEYQQLKPAIRVYAVIKAIERQYGLVFSDHFFNKSNLAFYNLYMWLHRRKGGVFEEGETLQTPMFNFGAFSGYQNMISSFSRLGFKNRIYQNPNNVNRQFKCGIIPNSSVTQYNFVIKKNGEEWFRQDNVVGTTDFINFSRDYDIESGEDFYTFFVETDESDTFKLVVDVKQNVKRLFGWSTDVTSATSYQLTTSSDVEIYAGTETPQIKVIDFLTGIFKMFNLTAYQEDNVIIVRTLDSFYDSSTKTHDITEYLDKSTSEVNAIMPYSEIELTYKGGDTLFCKKHEEFTNLKWGTAHFNNKGIYEGGTYQIEIPFEHQKFERLLDVGDNNSQTSIQWGWSVDDKQDSYLGSPLLFYVHHVQAAIVGGNTPIEVKKNSELSVAVLSYHIPSNTLELDTASQTIHFGAERNEYTNDVYTQSLFETYYKKYIVDSFNINRRLSKFKAYLPLSVINTLKLQDKIRIFNDLYKINVITTNFETGVSNLELINEVSDFRTFTNDKDLAKTIDTSVVTADNTVVTADTEELTI